MLKRSEQIIIDMASYNNSDTFEYSIYRLGVMFQKLKVILKG